jgi:hypothetical protein
MSDPLIREANISDCAETAELCALLWPDATAFEHKAEIEELIAAKMCGGLPFTIFVSLDQEGKWIFAPTPTVATRRTRSAMSKAGSCAKNIADKALELR